MRRGESITSSLQHLVYFPEEVKQNYPTIVALHGRGTDAYDLIPLVESLGLEMLVIAPRAPVSSRPAEAMLGMILVQKEYLIHVHLETA